MPDLLCTWLPSNPWLLSLLSLSTSCPPPCSVVLEMVEFIRAENIKALVSHLVEKFGAVLAEVDYVDTFQALRLKYDQVRRV